MTKWWLHVARVFAAAIICFVLFVLFVCNFSGVIPVSAPPSALKVETHLLEQLHVVTITNDSDKAIQINSVVINDGPCEALLWWDAASSWWGFIKQKLPPDGMIAVRHGLCQAEDRTHKVLIKTDDGDHLFGVE